MRYALVKVLLTVSPVRPSFSPPPRVYPQPLDVAHLLFSYTSELPLLAHQFGGPLFSYIYELRFPQLLCFDKHLRCPMFFPSAPSSQLCVLCASVVKKSLASFPSHCYKLIVVAKKLNSFAVKQIHTLLQKHSGGVGYAVPVFTPLPKGMAY